MSLKKAVAHQPVSAAIYADGAAFRHYKGVSFQQTFDSVYCLAIVFS